MSYDKRIDNYIEKAAPFAQPILKHIRKLVHQAYPEIEETMKWSNPHFEYKGMLCGMAAFKKHCVFGFFKHELILDQSKEGAMGQFGKLQSVRDLPSDEVMIAWILKAVQLNDAGIKAPKKAPPPKKELVVPDYLSKALQKSPQAQNVFENFSYSKKKEYLDWITEAKTEATRERRLIQAIEWISEG